MGSKIPDKLLFSSLISFFFVSLSQFSLFLLVYFFPFLSLLPMLLLSALLLIFGAAFGRLCRRLLRVSAFPPAFVFFSIVFLWGVYVYAIREGISFLKDVIVNVEFVLLTINLYRIINSDPGLVTTEYSCVNRSDLSALVDEGGLSTINGVTNEPPVKIQSPLSFERVRYCKICKAFIKGFDHHCPAFGNCIGKNNHLLFTILLIGFIIAEASYVACSTQFITRSKNSLLNGLESSLARNLATSTLLFSLLQVLWQMVFLVWHIHCICLNIKTDEWINWRRYPEFQLVVRPQPGNNLGPLCEESCVILAATKRKLILWDHSFLQTRNKKEREDTNYDFQTHFDLGLYSTIDSTFLIFMPLVGLVFLAFESRCELSEKI